MRSTSSNCKHNRRSSRDKETSKLQIIKIDFERLRKKYDHLSAELSRTTEELAQAVSILQSPEFAKILDQLSGEKK